MKVSRVVVVLAVLGTLFAAPTAASAAGAPVATTTPATAIGATGATLNGTVLPNKQTTTYSFHYGTTTAYATTAGVGTANGNATKKVSVVISGLLPSTVYHFRVTASNASGQSIGQGMTFTTAATPPATKNAVGIGVAPKTVTYGRSAVISGKVTGPKSGGAQVTLQSQPYPFTTPFHATGAVATASASGGYSFTVAPRIRTRYRVVAKTAPPVTSAGTVVNVRYAVSLFVSRTSVHRGAFVRFSGSVRTAANGRTVYIQRRSSTGVFHTVARALLRPTTSSTRSSYSKRLRVFASGVYRVRILGHTPYSAANSRTRRITVH